MLEDFEAVGDLAAPLDLVRHAGVGYTRDLSELTSATVADHLVPVREAPEDVRRLLHRLLDRIPARFAETVRLHLSGMSQPEIARRLGVSQPTVCERLMRAAPRALALAHRLPDLDPWEVRDAVRPVLGPDLAAVLATYWREHALLRADGRHRSTVWHRIHGDRKTPGAAQRLRATGDPVLVQIADGLDTLRDWRRKPHPWARRNAHSSR